MVTREKCMVLSCVYCEDPNCLVYKNVDLDVLYQKKKKIITRRQRKGEEISTEFNIYGSLSGLIKRITLFSSRSNSVFFQTPTGASFTQLIGIYTTVKLLYS